MFLSICIPSYNRPEELFRLLNSIDSKRYNRDLEVVICEDRSPKGKEIEAVVTEFKRTSNFEIHYYENPENYGYDKNLRQTAKKATGEYVLFMGDDDVFVPGSIDLYIDFLKGAKVGYVLRRYRAQYSDRAIEEYRYDTKNVFFEPGESTYVELFRRSLFISGFTYKRSLFCDYDNEKFDGTLLFQLYIQACVCLKCSAAYCDIPITMSIEGGIPFFGKSEVEQKLYTSGSNTIQNSLNFMKQVKYTAELIDEIFDISCTKKILETYSKYSYGFLLEHRQEGLIVYRKYAKGLEELGFACTPYFYIYYWMLFILGKKGARNLVMYIKTKLGKTPRL